MLHKLVDKVRVGLNNTFNPDHIIMKPTFGKEMNRTYSGWSSLDTPFTIYWKKETGL